MPEKDRKTTQEMANKANGGKGYYLVGGTTYDSSVADVNPVMNIDFMGNSPTFEILETEDGSVIADMNISSKALPAQVRNFTHKKTFTKIKCNVDVWLNRFA